MKSIRYSLVFLVLCSLFLLKSCSARPDKYVPVSMIQVLNVPENVGIGDSYELEITIIPEYATNKNYTIKSLNSDVVRVEGNSIIALKEGDAKVIVVSAEAESYGNPEQLKEELSLSVGAMSYETREKKTRDILVKFYDKMGGGKWIENENWCSDKPIAQWFGITYTAEEGGLREIVLPDNNLTGSLPEIVDEFGVLTNLERVYLYNNKIKGAIPTSVAKLEGLKDVMLSNNQMEGSLPDLSGLKNLTTLYLDNNFLSGNVFEKELLPTQLKELNLSENRFSGSITNATKLSLYCLDLSDNLFNGPLPEDMSIWSSSYMEEGSMWDLQLDHNKFTGNIPEQFMQLGDLRFLYLNNNELSGAIPRELYFFLTNIATNNIMDGNKGLEVEPLPKIEMVKVDGGAFMMGHENLAEHTKHKVTVSGFSIGKYEVTNNLWIAVMGKYPASYGDKEVEGDCPANMSWYEAEEFIARLNEETGMNYRFPTEAEWEYAARGGKYWNRFTYSGSNAVGEVGWYKGNSSGKLHPVGLKKANELGVHDMSGNALEWCSDWYAPHSEDEQINPTGLEEGERKVSRGGSYNSGDDELEVRRRSHVPPTETSNGRGLRLAQGTPNPNEQPQEIIQLEKEYEALIDFRSSAGGLNWNNSENWETTAPIGEWYGVTVNEDGYVCGLVLNNNGLIGSISESIEDLSNLLELDLSGNKLTGDFPEQVCRMTHLESLSLASNQFSGEIPGEICNLTNLKTLSLSNNKLVGTLPEDIVALTKLTSLYLDNNDLSGELSQKLADFISSIKNNNVYEGNDLTVVQPKVVTVSEFLDMPVSTDVWYELSGVITEIKNTTYGYLDIQDETASVYVYGLTSTRQTSNNKTFSNLGLRVGDTLTIKGVRSSSFGTPQVGGPAYYVSHIPGYLEEKEQWAKERQALVDLYNSTNGADWTTNTNWLSDKPVGEWYGVTTDENGYVISIDLRETNLVGEIPESIGDLKNLKTLDLGSNKISGVLPDSFISLISLDYIYLAYNQISGTIPESIGNLIEVTGLWLQGNQLTGTIPESLMNMTKLTALCLNNNNLSGIISKELADFISSISYNVVYEGNTLTIEGEEEAEQLAKERQALVDLYNSTDGENWTTNTNWLSDKPVGEWHGITTNSDGFVKNLSLGNNNMVGAIPESISALTSLESMWFVDNQITSMPTTIGELVNLKSLNLGDNPLTGSILDVLCSMTNLEDICLFNNNLTGTIPESIGNLTKLRRFDISNSQISGEIPDEIYTLTNLNTIYLGPSNVTGSIPENIDNLINLEVLGLRGCQISGTIPESIGNLTRLVQFSLRGNNLSGEIPATVGNMSNLYRFDVAENQLTGTIPESMANLPYLEVVNLLDNQLSGEIPAFFGEMTQLTSLHLNYNDFEGTIPENFIDLTNLEYLYLSNNNLSGEISQELADFIAGITNHDIYTGNNLTIEGQAETERLAKERQALVDLYNSTGGANWTNNENWLSDKPVGQWFGVTTNEDGLVKYLDMSDNNLTGTIPESIGNFKALGWMHLDGNQLTGSIPESIGDMEGLISCVLYKNKLTGSIPESISRLSSINVMNLSDNQLLGTIPDALCNMTNVAMLDLGNNQLTGEIPESISNLTNLGILRLNNNQLIGTIPSSIMVLDLGELLLCNNNLSGEISKELADFIAGIEYCNVYDGNSITIEGDDEAEQLAKERQALIDLYNSTDGANWTTNTNWLSDKPVGEWHGVTTDENGYVVELDLQENNLVGTIPSSIGDLKNIAYQLLLGENNLTGSIPESIGNLNKVSTLRLSGNNLTGSIPNSISRMTGLRYLNLEYNNLSGSIVEELGNMNLHGLDLHGNQLTGTIPESIWTSGIGMLLLNDNALEGSISTSIGNMSLTYLDLGGNKLSGTIPESIGNVTTLCVLRLGGNELIGTIPETIKNLTSLSELVLSYNKLSGVISQELADFISLISYNAVYEGNNLTIATDNPDVQGLRFGVDVVETKESDIVLNIDAPDGLPVDEYDTPMSYIVRWAPAAEIGSLADEELFQRELDVFADGYAEWSTSGLSYSDAVMSYAILYGDVTAFSLGDISSMVDCPIESATEYEIYVYALEVDETSQTCSLLTEITRVRATTQSIQMTDISFTFGYDRVTEDDYGLSAYFSVTPTDNEQTYTFCAFPEYSLQTIVEGATEMTEDVAKKVLQYYIDNNHSGFFTLELSKGYACTNMYNAVSVIEDSEYNRYYIVAAAVNAEYNICSVPQYALMDVTGLTSTDDNMNLSVTDNGDGTFSVSANPTGISESMGYIFISVTVTELEQYLADNNHYDLEVSTYVNAIVSEGLAAQGLADKTSDVISYLANGGSNGDEAVSGALNRTITPTEDTYVIAYTLYEQSGAVNGLAFEMISPLN